MKSLLQIADCHCVCVYGQHNPGLLHLMDSARGAAPCWKLCWNLPNYNSWISFTHRRLSLTCVYCQHNPGLLHSMDSARGAAPCWKNVTWVVMCHCWKCTWEGTWRRSWVLKNLRAKVYGVSPPWFSWYLFKGYITAALYKPKFQVFLDIISR